jgi:hypothetical protein
LCKFDSEDKLAAGLTVTAVSDEVLVGSDWHRVIQCEISDTSQGGKPKYWLWLFDAKSNVTRRPFNGIVKSRPAPSRLSPEMKALASSKLLKLIGERKRKEKVKLPDNDHEEEDDEGDLAPAAPPSGGLSKRELQSLKRKCMEEWREEWEAKEQVKRQKLDKENNRTPTSKRTPKVTQCLKLFALQ